MSKYVILINGQPRAVGELDPEIERLLGELSPKPVGLLCLKNGRCQCPQCLLDDEKDEAERTERLLEAMKEETS